jgi:hypothetical protein
MFGMQRHVEKSWRCAGYSQFLQTSWQWIKSLESNFRVVFPENDLVFLQYNQ